MVMRLSLLSLGSNIEPVTPASRSQVKHLSVAPANRGAVQHMMVTQFQVRILGVDGLAVNNEILSQKENSESTRLNLFQIKQTSVQLRKP